MAARIPYLIWGPGRPKGKSAVPGIRPRFDFKFPESEALAELDVTALRQLAPVRLGTSLRHGRSHGTLHCISARCRRGYSTFAASRYDASWRRRGSNPQPTACKATSGQRRKTLKPLATSMLSQSVAFASVLLRTQEIARNRGIATTIPVESGSRSDGLRCGISTEFSADEADEQGLRNPAEAHQPGLDSRSKVERPIGRGKTVRADKIIDGTSGRRRRGRVD